MKIFAPMYQRAIAWSRHPRAPAFLTGLSFIEAIIFPVPPEVMLAPMSLSQPKRALWFATLSLIGSIAGAVIGYLLGHYAFEIMRPLFEWLGMMDGIQAGIDTIKIKMAESPWAVFWLLVAGGFAPIPMKVFTWASGVVGVPWIPYLAAMAVGRGKRVYLVAIAIRIGGERAERALHRYVEPIGWAATAMLLVAIAYLIYKARGG
jgi:membrane protein YqaA with SNARE-associated domain